MAWVWKLYMQKEKMDNNTISFLPGLKINLALMVFSPVMTRRPLSFLNNLIMKKIFTLVFVSLFTIAAMANDRRPAVSVMNNTYFKVMIDGHILYNDYNGSVELRKLDYGRHTVTVLEERGGLFFSRRSRIISSSDFFIDDDDRRSLIHVDQYGYININKAEFDHDSEWNDRGFDDRNRKDFDRGNGRRKSYNWDDHKDVDSYSRGKSKFNKRF
jgi:hypothetical protein